MNIKWDAQTYTDHFSFVHEYGEDVIKLIEQHDALSVLDLGCGNGALTKKISDLGMNVIGMDASEELLKVARENYPDLTFIKGDATNFELAENVDVVLSNAVFHWIHQEKQMQMLKCVYKAMKDGGQFVFEFGGSGNNIQIHNALEQEFRARGKVYHMPFYFPTIGEYTTLLEKVGFKVKYAILFDRMTKLNGEDGLADWIKMFVKIPFEGMNREERETIINQAVLSLKGKLYHNGIWYADYVRIRGKAIK